MLQHLEFVAQFFVAAFEQSAASHTLWEFALIAAIGLAGGAVAVAVRTSILAAALPTAERLPGGIEPPRDTSHMLAQSAPDAAGKPRPRAPGLVTTTIACR